MCILAVAYNVHPQFPLILITNRDEFYHRPTLPIHSWQEEGQPEIIAGKDLEAGGTWLGMHQNGNLGILTNYRDLKNIQINAPSRGHIITEYLLSNETALQYLQKLKTKAGEYNGFNIILSDSKGLYHFSNHSKEITQLKPGIYGLSNALLDTPWPKLVKLKSDFTQSIAQNNLQPAHLFQILKNQEKAAEEELPQTGLDDQMEKAVSSIFIQTSNYGTRCSTLIFKRKDYSFEMIERQYDNKGNNLKDIHFDSSSLSNSIKKLL